MWGVRVRPSRIVALLIVCAAPLPILNCQSVVLGTMNAPARFGAYERRVDIAYGTHARQRLDVYVPSNPHRAHPIVIFWYGGAWLRGEKGQYRFVAAALAKSGYVAVLPDYRTYPEGVFPQFNDDGALAVRWVHEHAPELGGDRDAIFLMGHSAGAHLAASLALDKRYLAAVGGDPRWIRGLIGLSGPYALEPPPWPLWKIVFPEPYTADDWQPLRHASRDAPPTLLLYGGDDWAMARDQAEALAKMLRSLNVPITAHRYPNTSHFGTVAALSLPSFLGAPVIDDVNVFIAETLAAGR